MLRSNQRKYINTDTMRIEYEFSASVILMIRISVAKGSVRSFPNSHVDKVLGVGDKH